MDLKEIQKDAFYDKFTCHANNHINFKLIRENEDMDNNVNNITPSFTHQFYGENENIFGYTNLHINLWFSAGQLNPYFNVSYDEKLENDDMKADDFEKSLLASIPYAHRNIDLYREALENEDFKCFGKLIDAYQFDDKSFEIYHVFGTEMESEAFERYNNNLQYFLQFFVDGSSCIDISDSCWEYYIVYEKYEDSHKRSKYATIGFMTIFNFFAYPDNIRQRISQVLIFPPFQRQRHGQKLLMNFYKEAIAKSVVKDITVEDPSDQFQYLRDYIDCKNVLLLPEFNKEIVKKESEKDFINLLKTKLKLSGHQIGRVYEILGLKFVNKSNTIEGMKYKQSIIKRLSNTYGRAKDFAAFKADIHLGTSEDNIAIFAEREYERLEQCYSMVIAKLDKEL